MKEIAKRIVQNELYLFLFIVMQEIIRVLMKVREDLSISLQQVIIMVIIVAILSVIQRFIRNKNIN